MKNEKKHSNGIALTGYFRILVWLTIGWFRPWTVMSTKKWLVRSLSRRGSKVVVKRISPPKFKRESKKKVNKKKVVEDEEIDDKEKYGTVILMIPRLKNL
ncbi:hypothetical protein QVD17_12612 [Tagetes erecta]|uniref:Transmembrane protein n=1 Tax=Tagetes erecta TaxID=13708 RepID=A0AAD8KVV2_TARER|nr:hypothetical protein QVD17_12612 [Tagetes erecta]